MVGSGAKTSPLTAKAREIVKSGVLGKSTWCACSTHRNNGEGAWVYAIPPDASPQTVDWQRFLGNAPQRAYDPRFSSAGDVGGNIGRSSYRPVRPRASQLHEMMDVVGRSPWFRRSIISLGRWPHRPRRDETRSTSTSRVFLADVYVNLGNSHAMHGSRDHGIGRHARAGLAGPAGRAAYAVIPSPCSPRRNATEPTLAAETRRPILRMLGLYGRRTSKSPPPPPKPAQKFRR